MRYHILLLFLSLLSINHLINHVSSLGAEGIANGELVSQTDFLHQAAVVGRFELSDENHKLLGSGVLVSQFWMLCVARIFMRSTEKLRRYYFYAIIGFTDLTRTSRYHEFPIKEIHTFFYSHDTYENDISMAKVVQGTEPLGYTHPELNILRAVRPNPEETFYGRKGDVTGYGESTVWRIGYQMQIVRLNDSDKLLRRMKVKVESLKLCAHDFPEVQITTGLHFCGVSDLYKEESTGACALDIGSPLVIDGKVVGLVSKTRYDCDDTGRGALYIHVPGYSEFIHQTILDNKLPGVVIHYP